MKLAFSCGEGKPQKITPPKYSVLCQSHSMQVSRNLATSTFSGQSSTASMSSSRCNRGRSILGFDLLGFGKWQSQSESPSADTTYQPKWSFMSRMCHVLLSVDE